MKEKYHRLLVVALVAAAVLAFVLMPRNSYTSKSEDVREPDKEVFVIHWHPQLFIFINGNQSVIPANIGIYNGSEAPIHTHDDSGILHIEQMEPAEETLKLGFFFSKVWNKTLNSSCIFEYCNNATHDIRMWVNKKRNFGFGNLTMRDSDMIVIVFSKSYGSVSRF